MNNTNLMLIFITVTPQLQNVSDRSMDIVRWQDSQWPPFCKCPQVANKELLLGLKPSNTLYYP